MGAGTAAKHRQLNGMCPRWTCISFTPRLSTIESQREKRRQLYAPEAHMIHSRSLDIELAVRVRHNRGILRTATHDFVDVERRVSAEANHHGLGIPDQR